jgi:hypothetical protein
MQTRSMIRNQTATKENDGCDVNHDQTQFETIRLPPTKLNYDAPVKPSAHTKTDALEKPSAHTKTDALEKPSAHTKTVKSRRFKRAKV